MSTSGSDSYTQNRNQIILTAYQLMGIYGIGKTVSNEDVNLANTLLNMMIKKWQAQGYHLWTKQEGVLFLNPNQGEYLLGNGTTDAMATTKDNLIFSRLSSNASSGTTNIAVTSSTGMSINDNIGVVLSDKTIFWTTIASIPTSTSITLNLGLSGAALANSFIYTFTNKLTKPLRIIGMARYRTGYDNNTATSSQIDIPVTGISYGDYQNIPDKTSSGRCYQFHYNPKITDGKIFLFPRPSDGADRLHFTYERRIEDLLNSDDDIDFPDEWVEPITYQLAIRLGAPFGKIDRAEKLLPIAGSMLDDALAWDGEITDMEFRMDRY